MNMHAGYVAGALSLLLGLVTTAACGGAPKGPPPASARVDGAVLVPTDELSPPFVVQQRLKGQYGTRDMSLDCVLQLKDGKLTVLGLTPFGTRAFVIEQRGREVKLEKFIDREVPIDPTDVLADIHRVFFRGLPATESPRADGSYEQVDGGELVRETYKGGNLVERRFQSLEGPAPNLVVITYDGAKAPVIAPHVRLTNVAYGYTLDIDNTEQQLLEGGYTLEVEREGGEATR